MLKDEDVRAIAYLFTENVVTIENLYGFHNYIYKIIGDSSFVLRISKQDYQKEEATKSEIDFILYLKENNVPVAIPIRALSGQYVHNVSFESGRYIVSAFEVSKGKDFRSRGNDEKERFIIIGQTIGKIHRLSKEYKPINVISRRLWDNSPHLVKALKLFSDYNIDLSRKFDEYMILMKKWPKSNQNFGLIHGDFLFSNYFFDDCNNISIFDFDECEYSWYIYDIAVCMYYYLLGYDPKELSGKVKEAEEMFYYLMRGYQGEYHIDVNCLANFDVFFKMREFVLLSSILETSKDNLSGWSRDFVEGALYRQLNGKCFINVNFTDIYARAKRCE